MLICNWWYTQWSDWWEGCLGREAVFLQRCRLGLGTAVPTADTQADSTLCAHLHQPNCPKRFGLGHSSAAMEARGLLWEAGPHLWRVLTILKKSTPALPYRSVCRTAWILKDVAASDNQVYGSCLNVPACTASVLHWIPPLHAHSWAAYSIPCSDTSPDLPFISLLLLCDHQEPAGVNIEWMRLF